MESIVKELYYSWCNKETQDSQEVIVAFEELDRFKEQLRVKVKDDFFKLDDAIMGATGASQKQGFLAGFEIARKLMTGGVN